ncbi:TPA: hypothetical protein ACFOO3_002062, partial [Neisseria meningitidis]
MPQSQIPSFPQKQKNKIRNLKFVIPAQAGIQCVEFQLFRINFETLIPSFPRKWESRIPDFQIIFEYYCCSKVWIPACAGMTAERFLLLPINAAISNPVIPSKTENQNQKP